MAAAKGLRSPWLPAVCAWLATLAPQTALAGAAGDPAAALIEAARAAPRLTAPVTRKLADCRLSRIAERSTPYFDTLAGSCAHARVASAELRVPTRKTHARDGMLVLEFRPSPCAPMEPLAARYRPVEPYFPPPHAPAQTPIYLRVAGETERLSLAFDREPPHCLQRVVIDRTVR